MAARLLVVLARVVAPGWDVLADPGVTFDARNYRVPDVAVVRSAALSQATISPTDVLLAVEIMSPSSIANDRIAKAAQYATAGIPYFWRIEPDPPLLVQHQLEGGVYRESGRDRGVVEVSQPLAAAMDLNGLFS